MLQITTPIKINLAIHIIGQTNFNYLKLDSLVVFAKDGDILHVNEAEKDNFLVSGPYDFQLKDEKYNLVLRARDLLREYINDTKKCFPVAIALEKHLPVASGLGGGSGDAAACLILLNKIWNLNLSQEQILMLSQKLGADVPCCAHYLLNNSPLYMGGIGEILEELSIKESLHLLIVNNLNKTSTKLICENIQKKDNNPIDRRHNFYTLEELIRFLKKTRNDFLETTIKFTPSIMQMLEELKQDSLFSTMSGSGASCVAIYKTIKEAESKAKILKQQYPNWFIKTTLIEASKT